MLEQAPGEESAIEDMRDPYKTLGVRQDAGADEIKAAWRTMAKAIHPDHNRDDPTATARFAEVGRAYETLKDPQKRSRYDQVLNMAATTKSNGPTIMQQRQAAREAEERAKAARANAERVMEELARATAQKAQKAATAAAAGTASTAAPQPTAAPSAATASPTAGAATESAEDMVERIFGARAAAAPSEKPAAAQKQAEAPAEPSSPGDEVEPVVATGGLASIIALPPFGLLTSFVRRITGTAIPVQDKAPEIAAEASVTIDDIIKGQWVTVALADGREAKFQAAAGMGDGHVVHLKGQGLKLQGMQRGDVAVTLHLAADDRFTVKDYDLHTALPVTIENAVLGWETSVEGPHGKVAVTVPAWSGSDRTIRVAGEGLPDGKGGRGDLVVALRLMLWEKPDHKMTDLMRSMKDGLFL